MNKRELARRRPWSNVTVPLPDEPAGMLGAHEARLCYWLAKSGFAGLGTIVDAGSFLGKSAYFLAQGLRANPEHEPGKHRIHCFDNFLVNEDMTVQFIRQHFGKDVAIGDSTRGLFEAQVEPVRDTIEVHAGDLHSMAWTDGPIEILMVDIAKSESLGRRVVEMFFPDLIPGESFVIQQDYHHPWLPHIHIVMEYLADYFELVAPRVDDSAVFRYQRPIPPALLARAARFDFTADEQLRLMRAAVRRLAPEDRYYVELAGIVLKGRMAGGAPAALAELDELRRRFNTLAQGYSDNPYFEDVALHLKELEGWRLKAAGAFTECLQVASDILSQRASGYALLMRGCALLGLERDEEAERDIRAAIAASPPPGYAYVELAHLLRRRHRLAEAEAAILRGLRDRTAQGPSTKDYLEALFWIWHDRSTPMEERQTLAMLFRELPDDPEVWLLDGRLHRMSGDVGRAEQSWRQAAALGLPGERLERVRES